MKIETRGRRTVSFLPSCSRLTSCSPEFVHAPPWNLRFIDERLLGFGQRVRPRDPEGGKDKLPCLQQPSKKRSGTRFSSWRAYRIRSGYIVNLHVLGNFFSFFSPSAIFCSGWKERISIFRFHATASPRLAEKKRATTEKFHLTVARLSTLVTSIFNLYIYTFTSVGCLLRGGKVKVRIGKTFQRSISTVFDVLPRILISR